MRFFAIYLLCISLNTFVIAMEENGKSSAVDGKQKKSRQVNLRDVLDPIPLQVYLVGYAYKNLAELKSRVRRPEKVLLFGPQSSGKTFMINVLAQELNAQIHSFSPIPCADDVMQQALTRQCDFIAKKTIPENSISVLHCSAAQHLFKGHSVSRIMNVINTHISEMNQKKVATLFIAEQRDCPEGEIIPHFNQVIKMPMLDWKDQKKGLEYFFKKFKTDIDWEAVKESRAYATLEKGELENIADEAILTSLQRDSGVISTQDILSSLDHWQNIIHYTERNLNTIDDVQAQLNYLSFYS